MGNIFWPVQQSTLQVASFITRLFYYSRKKNQKLNKLYALCCKFNIYALFLCESRFQNCTKHGNHNTIPFVFINNFKVNNLGL